MKYFIYIFLSIFIYLLPCFSQITVSPVMIHLSDTKNTASFTVYNTTSDTIECLTNNNFGYPISDDSGNVYVKMFDTIPVIEPSAKEWIKLYPKNFFIYPYSSQVVRVLAKPPENLSDGEYWSRPSITAKKKNTFIDDDTGNRTINAKIGTELKIFLVINYRHNSVYTNVIADLLSYHFDGKNLVFLVNLEKIGNAAFLGRIGVKLSNNNDIFYEDFSDIAIYHKLKKRIEIPKEKVTQNNFKAEIVIDSERNDAGAEIIKINPIIIQKQINLNN